jgi:tetratricopeptide (TPR) repeat protein
MFLLAFLKKTLMDLSVARSYHGLVLEAKEAEENNELEKAAKIYERAIKMEPHEEEPYNRLMIIYRKLTRYEDELKIIKKGIASFEELYQKKSERLLGKNQSVARLSNALAKSLGQKGKKTESLYLPEPIPKWMKRQKLVEKKLGMG